MTPEQKKFFEKGRLSVLQDFDAMCMADAFVGFSDEEWSAVQKFFEFNKQVSGWDKDLECDECGGTGDVSTMEQVYAGEPHMADIGTAPCPKCKGRNEEEADDQE